MAGPKLGYNEEIGNEICEVISDSPKMLEDLCEEYPHWPSAKTIYKWRRVVPSFGKKYEIAKQEQIEPLVNQIILLCDKSDKDFYVDSDGKIQINKAYLTRLRYKIDSIKWFASKLAPKLYGDKKDEEKNPEDFLQKLLQLAKDK